MKTIKLHEKDYVFLLELLHNNVAKLESKKVLGSMNSVDADDLYNLDSFIKRLIRNTV